VRQSAAAVEETRTGGLGIRCEGVVHLYKTFGGHDVVALRGVDLTIRPGGGWQDRASRRGGRGAKEVSSREGHERIAVAGRG